MRIARWNVAYGRGKTANRRRLSRMQEINADIWILTETHDDLSPGDEFRAVRSQQRPHGHGDGRVNERSRWVTIWSRKILRTELLDVKDPERSVACVIETDQGAMWIFGTVLPWYGDARGVSVKEEVELQCLDWNDLNHKVGNLGCVAGDFNVNLDGPHYYGSRESKAAVKNALEASGLVALTDYSRTEEARPDFGLIDHIAVSSEIADESIRPLIWEKRNDHNELLSDHLGVSVDLVMTCS